MGVDFKYFVIFAGMRTGSNFLEVNLNEYAGLNCLGEVFNPHFIGQPNKQEMLGMSMKDRESDPLRLVRLLKDNSSELSGFRFFHDHDPRVLEACLADPKCAKIVLTRKPLDSYISREIARQTGQWRLSDVKHAKVAKIKFDHEAFVTHLTRQQEFQGRLKLALQTTGQTAFYIGYDDISNIEVLNGLARYLGVDEVKESVSKKTKKQNPQPLEEKVSNLSEMKTVLTAADNFQLGEFASFEPARGPAIPSYIAATNSPVLFMPISSGPTGPATKWLAELDGVSEGDLIRAFNQKILRQWKRRAKGHRSFTVIRHPVARLHDAFVRRVLIPDSDAADLLRQSLREVYNVQIPKNRSAENYQREDHRFAFRAFARFVKGNLNGQTSLVVNRAWASQSEILRGMGQFMLPGNMFLETELQEDLDNLARKLGIDSPKLGEEEDLAPFSLSDIYDEEIETSVRAAYQRDYMMFGFKPWNT